MRILLFSVVTALTLAACNKGEGSKEGDGGSTPDGAVKAVEGVVAEGMVVPIRYSTLAAPAGGIVREVLVEEGRAVDENQVLIRLDAREIAARLANSRAELARAQAALRQLTSPIRAEELAIKDASVNQARIDEKRAADELKRAEQLKERGALSEQEVEKLRGVYARAVATRELSEADQKLLRAGPRSEQVAASEAGVMSARAVVQQMEAALQNTELRAPFAGAVAYLEVRVGEFVAPGTPLVRIADTSHWVIRTEDLTELAVVRVEKGALVKLTFDAIPGLELPGHVTHIRAFGELKKGDMTYTAVIEPMQQDPRMRWNMTASVQIAPPGSDGGLVFSDAGRIAEVHQR